MGISASAIAPLTSDNHQIQPQMDEIRSVPAIPHHAWYFRGKILTENGYFEAALNNFDIALKYQPNQHQIWAYRGIALAYLKSYESALASFNKALELAPDNREIWIFRGAALTFLKRRREAINSYTVALGIQQQGFTVSEEYPTTWLPNPLGTAQAFKEAGLGG